MYSSSSSRGDLYNIQSTSICHNFIHPLSGASHANSMRCRRSRRRAAAAAATAADRPLMQQHEANTMRTVRLCVCASNIQTQCIQTQWAGGSAPTAMRDDVQVLALLCALTRPTIVRCVRSMQRSLRE